IYFAPVFASQSLSTPIPKLSVVDQRQIGSLFNSAALNLSRDYTNAANWYPTSNLGRNKNKAIQSYKLSIPKLNIIDATVSTTDNDLSSHLVNFQGTSVPPEKGNSVIFGHSTLPQLFDPKNYKTIFANAYKLQVGDEVFVNLPNISYKYRIMNITIVEPDDTSVLEQNYNTIFANAYKLQVGDEVFVNLPNISYKYRIMNITIVEPDDTSVLEQNYN